jgi:iron complex transport system ATP-binding protein
VTEPLLETRRLRVAIAGKRVCDALDLVVRESERWVMLGMNGIGKTTLLRTLAGLRRAESGEIRLAGRPLASLKGGERARLRGMLFQAEHDDFETTVMESVLAGRHPHIPAWGWETVRDVQAARTALARVALADFDDRRAARLSGGERRRVSIATLLAQDPALMMLDEPTSHLDVHHQIAILELLAGMARDEGKAVFMTLHDVTLAARFCSHALLLFGNGETMQGAVAEMLQPATLARLYAHPVERIDGPRGPVFAPG